MKKYILLFGILGALSCFAQNCDLSEFRWECELPVGKPHPSMYRTSAVSCGGIVMFVTPWQYEKIVHNRALDVDMVLKVNDEYFSGPCVPVAA